MVCLLTNDRHTTKLKTRTNRGDKMEESISWAELAELTHKTQVEKFNFCMCEEQQLFPYEDCPRLEETR